MASELALRRIAFEQQKQLPIEYKGVKLRTGYQLDFLVDNRVVVELKAVEQLLPVHRAQLLSYMKLGHWQVGLLLNFQVEVMRRGVKSVLLTTDEH